VKWVHVKISAVCKHFPSDVSSLGSADVVRNIYDAVANCILFPAGKEFLKFVKISHSCHQSLAAPFFLRYRVYTLHV